jgi:hypothetical protein
MKVLNYLIVAIALTSLTACLAARPPARVEISDLPALEDCWSRVFIDAGVTNGVKLWSVHQVGPVYFNGEEVGTTARDEHFAVDVKPGDYEVSCQPHEPAKNFVEKRSVSLGARETKYFICNMASGSGIWAGLGLIGALAAEYHTKSYLEERPIETKNSKLVGYQRLPLR